MASFTSLIVVITAEWFIGGELKSVKGMTKYNVRIQDKQRLKYIFQHFLWNILQAILLL